jgi:hypothetical protein
MGRSILQGGSGDRRKCATEIAKALGIGRASVYRMPLSDCRGGERNVLPAGGVGSSKEKNHV